MISEVGGVAIQPRRRLSCHGGGAVVASVPLDGMQVLQGYPADRLP